MTSSCRADCSALPGLLLTTAYVSFSEWATCITPHVEELATTYVSKDN